MTRDVVARPAARLAPTGLRLLTLGSRFMLVFFLARLIPAADVGRYGLLTAMVGFVIIALGFDFYTYSTRQIIRGHPAQRRVFLRSQIVFALLLYAVGYPLLLLLFVYGALPWNLAVWFLILVPLEHLGLELDRLLIALSDQLGASVVLFLGSGALPVLLVPLMVTLPGLRELDAVLAGWVGFDAVSIAAGLVYLSRHLRGGRGRVDWAWIRHGTRAALPFILGTLGLRALFTVDRQVVAAFADLKVLAAYTLFMSIAAGMTQLLYAGVHQFAYPKLIRSAHERNRAAFLRGLRLLALQSLAVVAGVSLAVLAFRPLLLHLVGGGVYAHYAWILPCAMAATGIYNLSLVPHYGLYALDADRQILTITLAAFVVFSLAIVLLVRLDAAGAVLIGVGCASGVLLVGKSAVLVMRLKRFSVDRAPIPEGTVSEGARG